MRYAICNETFQDRDLAAGFAFAAACGYTGIEIAPFTLAPYARDISPTKRAEVVAAAKNAGLEVVGLHWLLAQTEGFYLTSPDVDVRKKTGAYLGELAALCRDLGGSLMVLGSPKHRNLLPGVTLEQAHEFAADTIARAESALAKHDVTIAVEPLGRPEGDFLTTSAEGVELIERINSPHVRLHLDCKAMSDEPTPIPDLIRTFAGQLHHFHANDPNRQGPGFGEVKFPPIMQALRDVGYDGWVSVEVFDYAPGVERLARESIEYLKRCEAPRVGG
ncbi:MAG: sugar phosphate isomerase/epimerase family protein [Pirellulales bacterium]